MKGFDLGLPDGGVAQATSLGPKWIFADDEFFLFSPSLPGRFGHVKLDRSDLVVLIRAAEICRLGNHQLRLTTGLSSTHNIFFSVVDNNGLDQWHKSIN